MPVYDVYQASAHAHVTLSPAGANNDILVYAKDPGTGGNSITVTLAVAGTGTALSVSVAGEDITVHVATDGGGAPTSTAQQVVDAINASAGASALVFAKNAPANSGAGVVAAVGSTPLANGTANDGNLILVAEGVQAINDVDAVSAVATDYGEYVTLPWEMQKHQLKVDTADTAPFSRAEISEEED